jgi:hypothetical protein
LCVRACKQNVCVFVKSVHTAKRPDDVGALHITCTVSQFSTMVPYYLLLFLCLLRRTNGFASYLLGRTGCRTELATDEVIMNNHVEEVHPENAMRIVLTETNVVAPMTLSLQVLPDTATTLDYEFVIDILYPEEEGTPIAQFQGGGCENNKRIASRGKEVVTLNVEKAGNFQLVAGWATSHEAVKLTPVLEIVAKGGTGAGSTVTTNEAEAEEHDENKDWTVEFLSECAPFHDSSQHSSHIEEADEHEETHLKVGSPDRSGQVELNWIGPDIEQVVLETSLGASFEHGYCNGKRQVAKTWPIRLTIHQNRDITIAGIYRTKEGRRLIKRMHTLTLEWKDEDPQKTLEHKKPDLHQQRLHHKRKLDKQDKKNDETDESSESHDASADKQQSEEEREEPESAENDDFEQDLMVEFGGSSYLYGVSFYAVALFVVIKLCLMGSRTYKGRRDL